MIHYDIVLLTIFIFKLKEDMSNYYTISITILWCIF